MNYPWMMCPARRWSERLAFLLMGLAALPALAQSGVFSPLPEARPAPRLILPDLEERKLDLATLRGRVVVVNFWATWCPPCRREFPSLGRLQKLFKPQDLTVVAVNVGEDSDTAFAFSTGTGIIVLLDQDSRAMADWRVSGLPSTFVLDRQGRVVLRAVGGREFDSPAMVAQLKQLLK